MSEDGSARSDLPAGGQEELGGVSHSERMMADMMKMLANLTMQNQQLLQQHLQQTAAAAGDRGVQQQSTDAADNRRLHQQMAAGDGARVQESGGAREGRVIDSRGSLVRETSVKQESLSGEGRQPSLAASYPGFRVAALAPVEDVLRRDGQREESGTARDFGPARESATMFGFGQEGFKMSETSRPHRNGVLKSSAGEMKAEPSHTRTQIEQMMGMIQQLLQAKSAEGDQHKEKSGGSGRGGASNDDGGAGRAPREEGLLAQ